LKFATLCISSRYIKYCIKFITLISFCSVTTLVSASVSLERTIKESDGSQLNAVSALLAGNEGRLLVLDSNKGMLSEYKGKANTSYSLIKKKVFKSEDTRGLARLNRSSYLVSNADENVIAVIDDEGNLLQKFGEGGSREGQLDSPAGIDWSHNGRLYVADKGNDRISVFGLDGVFIKAFGHIGLKSEQRLDDPLQVYVDLKERVYVLEKRNKGIVSIFNHDGKLLEQLINKDFNKIVLYTNYYRARYL